MAIVLFLSPNWASSQVICLNNFIAVHIVKVDCLNNFYDF